MEAVIDIGSNTIKLLIARKSADVLEPIHSTSRTVRLAEGFSSSLVINPKALARAQSALEEIKEELLEFGNITPRIVATAAVREAKNGFELCKIIEEIFSVKVEILSGQLEAHYSMLGSSHCLKFLKRSSEEVLFLDHGGASTEVGSLYPSFFAQSFPIGAVNAYEMLNFTESAVPNELWNERDAIFDKFFTLYPLNSFIKLSEGRKLLLAAGGTLLQMAIAMKAERVTDELFLCQRKDVETFIEELRKLSVDERESKIKIEHGRADIMPAGVSLVLYLMKKFQMQELAVTTWGLRHGLLS